MNRHGDPSRTKGTIEWEGTAEAAEHTAWHPPYILIFDSRFIEVRHAETGRLCQVIPSNDLRCTMYLGWTEERQCPPVAAGPNGAWKEAPLQEARVHGVMRADDASIGRAGPWRNALSADPEVPSCLKTGFANVAVVVRAPIFE